MPRVVPGTTGHPRILMAVLTAEPQTVERLTAQAILKGLRTTDPRPRHRVRTVLQNLKRAGLAVSPSAGLWMLKPKAPL